MTVPPPSTSTSSSATRDRYIDTLRAAALIRVVAYHVYGWIWLPVAFPSMGIMFALAGSLMAESLDRSAHRPWGVIGRRMKRLLPPLWLMGVLLVPLMIWHGWTHHTDDSSGLDWKTLFFWVLPISDPPGSDWGVDWVVPLWYIRTYLWFVVLSPSFLWLFRRWPKRVMAVPLTLMLLVGIGAIDLNGRGGDIVLTAGTFGACWLLGFAHHDGRLRALPLRIVLPLGMLLLAAGLGWALTHPDPTSSWNVDDIPAAQTLYSLGAVVLLLRAHPTTPWTARSRVLAGLVTAINSRAVTIYLWNNVAIFLAVPLIGSWSWTSAPNTNDAAGQTLLFAITWLCLIIAVLAFGWVEDAAAGRKARINPWPRVRRSRQTRPPGTALAFRIAILVVLLSAAGSLSGLATSTAPQPTGVASTSPASTGLISTSLISTGAVPAGLGSAELSSAGAVVSRPPSPKCPSTASCTRRPGRVTP